MTTVRLEQAVIERRVIRRDGRILGHADAQTLSHGAVAAVKTALAAVRRVSGQPQYRRALSGSIVAVPLMFSANLARAQAIAPLVTPTIEPDYNRGRNVSVNETYDPNYDPLGMRFGSIVAFPTLAVTTGVTSNVYVNNNFKRADGFYFFQPALRVTTDLPVHRVTLLADASIQRYAHETLRNQTPYNLLAEGELELGTDWEVLGRVQYARTSESPFATDLASNVSILSEYTRFTPSLNVVYKSGRVRLTGKAERIELRFKSVTFEDGSVRDQRARDRDLNRGSFQAEYGLSPSIAVFGQLNYDETNYPRVAPGTGQNRGSKGGSVLGGVNFDLTGLMRGSIAAGYVKRDYDAATFKDVSGLLWQVQAEFFPTPLTTIGVGAQRLVQDSILNNEGAYADVRATVAVDHALLRNLIVSGNLSVIKQERLNNNAPARFLSTGLSARYQSNRFITLGGSFQYSRGRPGQNAFSVPFDEARGQVFVRLSR